MARLKKKSLICCLICGVVVLAMTAAFLLFPTATASADTFPSGLASDKLGEAIDAFLQEHKDNHAAVAVCVFDDTQDLYSTYFGYTDEAGTVPLDENSVLEWGSVSKLTIWVSVMQLVEQGKLDLRADIRTYLPKGFLTRLHYDEPITMLNLMNHNAGFEEPTFDLETDDVDKIIPLGAFLASYQPAQIYSPGSVVSYSNWGAALAGYIVELVSEMPYSEYVQRNIFEPLGMNHTAIAADLSDNLWVQQHRTAVTYTPAGELVEDSKHYIHAYPAGMCCSTFGDYVTFAKALFAGDGRLMSIQSFEEMYSCSLYYTDTYDVRNMHGFWVDGNFDAFVFGHSGNTMGGSSAIRMCMVGNVAMAVMTNQLGGATYRTKMAKLVFGECQREHATINGNYNLPYATHIGPLKIGNLFQHPYLSDEMADGLYVNVASDRIEIGSTDYLRPTVMDYVADIMTVVWFAAMVYSLVLGIILVIRMRQNRTKDEARPLALATCVGMVLGGMLLLIGYCCFDSLLVDRVALRAFSIVEFGYTLILFTLGSCFTVRYRMGNRVLRYGSPSNPLPTEQSENETTQEQQDTQPEVQEAPTPAAESAVQASEPALETQESQPIAQEQEAKPAVQEENECEPAPQENPRPKEKPVFKWLYLGILVGWCVGIFCMLYWQLVSFWLS